MQTWGQWQVFLRVLGSAMVKGKTLTHTGLTKVSSVFSYYTYLWRWPDGVVAYNMSYNNVKLKKYSLWTTICHNGKKLRASRNKVCQLNGNLPYVCVKDVTWKNDSAAWRTTTTTTTSNDNDTDTDTDNDTDNDNDNDNDNDDDDDDSAAIFPVLRDGQDAVARTNLTLKECAGRHLTHDFLACDPLTDCGPDPSCPDARGSAGAGSLWAIVTHARRPMYVCDMREVESPELLPYHMVCDSVQDCSDGSASVASSDERYCERECVGMPWDLFPCDNGRCIPKPARCDGYVDCRDLSDESDCRSSSGSAIVASSKIGQHFVAAGDGILVDFSAGVPYFVSTVMSETSACPDTHFRCSSRRGRRGHPGYCLPVYVRCNGVRDCPHGEDERGCQRHRCPGFFRCRNSTVCVHVRHLCDGLAQCPQVDDEANCPGALSSKCPGDCSVCAGRTAVCPNLRRPTHLDWRFAYVDLSGSRVGLWRTSQHLRAVTLRYASSRLRTLADLNIVNLQVADFDDNLIQSLELETVRRLRHLMMLRLSRNPLTAMLLPSGADAANESELLGVGLYHLDASRSQLDTVDFLSSLPRITFLNMSFTRVAKLTGPVFELATEMKVLDLRGCPVTDLTGGLLSKNSALRYVFADNYRVCCKDMLPPYFAGKVVPGQLSPNKCTAPSDEISSCEDLLRAFVYRASLWTIGVLSVVGNAGCFFYRVLLQRGGGRTSLTGFGVFVANLSFADSLMGVYLLLVGVADARYRGRYNSHEKSWTSSVACKLAGFLSLLSSEVSAFTICLITLDRFLVLRFPFGKLRFRGRSSAAACGVAWLAGACLAGVPLLPVTAHWRFYSQTGICIPLPVTRRSFAGWDFSFGVMIVFNFALFVLIAAGQVLVYLSVRLNAVAATDTTRKSQDLTIARRLGSVVLSDFLCWFPIGLLGLLAAGGVPVPGELNVAMAIFVLPLNSALNPFLYTLNVVLEGRQRAKEARLLRLLEARAKT